MVGPLRAEQSSEPCWEWPVTRCVVLCSQPDVPITLPPGTGVELSGLPERSSTGGDSAGQNPGTLTAKHPHRSRLTRADPEERRLWRHRLQPANSRGVGTFSA